MPEVEQISDSASVILKTAVGNEKFRNALLSSAGRERVLGVLREQVRALDDVGTRTLITQTFEILRTEDEQTTQDHRDAAFEVFSQIDLEKVDGYFLGTSYIKTLEGLPITLDPYGAVTDVLKVGKMIAPHIDTPQWMIRGPLFMIAYRFRGEERDYVVEEGRSILDSIPNWIERPQEPVEEQEGLGAREKPDFEPNIGALYDAYFSEVNKNKTFKRALWENTPNFRKEVEETGIRLEHFWNLTRPEAVAASIREIGTEESILLRNVLNRNLIEQVGLSLEEIDEEKAMVLADEIISAVQAARLELDRSAGNFETTIVRLKKLIQDASSKDSRGQRQAAVAVVKFFFENGVDVEANLTVLGEVLEDEVVVDKVKGAFGRRDGEKREAAEKLEAVFSLNGKEERFALSSRKRDDLYLGDITGDCTSYHLNVGFNAWTVPVWLSDPGFNFYKISDRGSLVAKLGIILAVGDGKPVIVVDSIETAKNIDDEDRAVKTIHEGLIYLGDWAKRIGAARVVVNTIANSNELPGILNQWLKNPGSERFNELIKLGGLSGVSELRKNLIGQEERSEVYLQSSHDPDIDNAEERYLYDEQRRLIEVVEGNIQEALSKAEKNEVALIEDSAKSYNWPRLFEWIMKKNFPLVYRALGGDWQTYKEKYISIESAPSIYTPLQRDIQSTDLLEGEDPSDLEDEVEEVERFLVDIGLIEYHDLVPEEILRLLFKEAVVEEEGKMRLKTYLSVLGSL